MALLCFTWRAVPSSGTCKPQVGRRFHRILLDLSPAHQWSPHFHQSLCLTALTLHYQRVRVHLCTAPVGVHLPITTLSAPRVQCSATLYAVHFLIGAVAQRGQLPMPGGCPHGHPKLSGRVRFLCATLPPSPVCVLCNLIHHASVFKCIVF